MEFIATALEAHAAAGKPADAARSPDFLQRGFERLEAQGKMYRLDPSVSPTKFMDATLNRAEVETLREVVPRCVLSGHGRVSAISDDGMLTFEDGATVTLPWAGDASAAETTRPMRARK